MSRVSKGLWGLAAFLSLGVALFSYRLLAPDPPAVGDDVLANLMRRPWLPIHAGFAATALLVGPFQFLPRLRLSAPKLHRTIGKIYVAACLASAPAGLLLAWGTDAGPIAQWGFGTLGVLWFSATAYAFWLATQGRIAEHRRWMIRSFAMTFAAVTLRLYLPIPPMFLHMSFLEGYRIISWFSWTSNLLVVELFLSWTALRAMANRTADRVLSAGSQ
ncbi:DUF2306 domain-containing protein [Phenylobacterium sp.]|uniref:DUF2306 domain-containing protein n=1 Tax=Phenylobacterium sp. TaxID=1871053 RepID=UPI00356AD934